MECSNCHLQNPEDASFCDECGSRLLQTCGNCGSTNRAKANYCSECGNQLDTFDPGKGAIPPDFPSPISYIPEHLKKKIIDNRAALEDERKQVTIMFADLKGSTEIIADRDPEEADNLLKPIIHCMMEAVHKYEGTVVRVMGDGIMALFGAPISHEDHALRACYSALAAHEEMGRLIVDFRQKYGINPQIRIGLNSGQVIVRNIDNDLSMEYTAMGEAAHLAARMEELASSDRTLLTEHTFRHVEGFVKVNDLGALPIKGITNPVHVYELTDVSTLRSRMQVAKVRGLSPFVGRAREVEMLTETMNQAGSGHGQVIGVSGEAGVGKTRLFYEFTQNPAMQDWLVIETDSVSYGKATAYLPVIGLLKSYCHIEDHEEDRAIREKVSGKLVTLDNKLMSNLPALLSLLHVEVDDSEWLKIDPPQRRERTFEAVKQLLLRESQEQPVCLVVENLHWIDAETQTLLDRLIESLPTARLLVLTNYRPEYQHTWGNRSCYTQMRLAPLAANSARELLSAMLGDASEMDALKDLLIEHTGGNPFFLEEIVRELVETEVLAGSAGSYSLKSALPKIDVPDTVQAVLAARLDRLEADDKHLLQTASVIGMDVLRKLLAAVSDMTEETLAISLTHLQTSEFLYESNLFPEKEYSFWHALTQEVTYESLLTEQRRALHVRIADTIERLFKDRLIEHIDRLANHTFLGEQWYRAIKYLRAVSNKRTDQSAYLEAAASLERALVAVGHLPEGEEKLQLGIDIRFELRSTLQPLGEHGRVSSYLREAEKLSLELEDQDRLGWASAYLCQYLWWERDAQGAEELGNRALDIASKLNDLALEAATNHFLAQGYFNVGSYNRAIERTQQNITLLTGDRTHERLGLTGLPAVLSRIYLSWALAEKGQYKEGLRFAEEAINIAKDADQAYSLASAYLGLGQIQVAQGDHKSAIPVLEGVTELCSNLGLPLIQRPASAVLSLAYASMGRLTDALSIVEIGIPIGGHVGIFDTPMSIVASGAVYLMAGELGKAERVAASTGEMVEQRGYLGHQARVSKLLGDIYSAYSPPKLADAKSAYQKALSMAEELEMRPLIEQCNCDLGALPKTSDCQESG